MGGIARLAIELGHTISGSDQNTYPPMSTQLAELGVTLCEGYAANNIPSNTNIVIVGNTISRTNPELEWVLDHNIAYTSGAQWLSENVLRQKWVLAIAGTHGKTTTSSLLAWILDYCGYQPGFLIGGVPENFGISARLGSSDFFVIEADEYDTAFSDKRSKFLHYHPKTLVINNLEFDHADIFSDLGAIQTQFHHLLKILPQRGQLIFNGNEAAVNTVIEKGCWSEQKTFTVLSEMTEYVTDADASEEIAVETTIETTEEITTDWQIKPVTKDGSKYAIHHDNKEFIGEWELIGEHNLNNAISAVAAAHHVGVPIAQACEALSGFKSVKRRLELSAQVANINVYDDFAHHPTAIEKTITALRNRVGEQRVIAVIEPRSNTMRMGVHKDSLARATELADIVCYHIPNSMGWQPDELDQQTTAIFDNVSALIQFLCHTAHANDHILIMSNGSFDNIHLRLAQALSAKHAS